MKLELKNLTSYKLGKDGIKVILNENGLREIWDTDSDNSCLQDLYYISSIDYDYNNLQLVSVVNKKYGLDDIEITMISLALNPLSKFEEILNDNWEKDSDIRTFFNDKFITEKGFENIKDMLEWWSYGQVQVALKYRIDIYDLIQKNLAIDKTTLK